MLISELNEFEMRHLDALWEADYLDDKIMFFLKRKGGTFNFKIHRFKVYFG